MTPDKQIHKWESKNNNSKPWVQTALGSTNKLFKELLLLYLSPSISTMEPVGTKENRKMVGVCTELCPPPKNPYAKALTLTVTIIGDRTFREILNLK